MRRQTAEKPKKKLLMLGVVSFVTAISVMIISGIGASLWGVELYSIEQEIAQLEEENRKVTSQIVEASSLTEIYVNAEELGFVKPTEVVYAEDNTSVAQLPQ